MSASGSATIDYEYRRGPGRGGWKGVMFDLSSTVMSRIKEGFFGQMFKNDLRLFENIRFATI